MGKNLLKWKAFDFYCKYINIFLNLRIRCIVNFTRFVRGFVAIYF